MILKHSRIFSLIIILLSAQLSWAGSITPAANLPTYYSGVNGKSGATLWSAVHTVAAEGFSGLSYTGLWTAYYITDTIPGSTTQIIDMYGGCTFTSSNQDKGSGGTTECDKYNREHSIPKSWFGGSTADASPGTDLFHVVPADKLVNNKRSDNAFGEVETAEYTSSIGSKLGTPKAIAISKTMLYSGKDTTVNCSTSKVFEPIDDYKGDFARGYFGTLLKWTDYSNKFTTGDGAAMFSDSYTAAGHWGLTPYGIALLMKWHRQDPVSLKEIQRNNKVQLEQGNRNPFIDYPDLAEYIWGSHAGETFYLASSTATYTDAYIATAKTGLYGEDDDTPTLTVSSSSLTVDPVAVNGTSTKTFTVTGANLTGNITITRTSGSGFFTVSPSPITSGYNGSNIITVTYHPTSTGDHTATFTIASTGATSKTVTVSGTCTTVYNVTWRADDGSNPYHSNTAASGSKPTLPSENPDDCSTSRVFMGWTDDSDYSGDGSDLFTDSEDAPPITSTTTFYAVYADKSTSGSGARSLSKATSISAGDSVVFVCENATMELTSFTTSSTLYGVGTSYSGTPAGTFGFKVVAGYSSGTYAFQRGSDYLYWTSSNTLTTNSTLSANTSWNVSISSGNATITNSNTSTRQIVWNVNSPRFATYNSPSIGNSYYNIQLYKISGGTTTTYSNYSTQCSACTPVAATASYAHSSRTTTCGGTVSNAFTTNSNATVSYSSNNTSVATVASDGTVTPVGQGSATITATVPANTCFTGGASASFTLTVNRNTGTASFNTPTTTVNKDALVTNLVTTNSDGAVTYSSSNTSVATVNASGVVTGISAGTAIITANVAQSTCYTAASANYTITVYDFKANAATDVTCESFTANWNTSGAASYSLDVYQGTTSSTTVNRDTTWLNESFASSSQGEFTIDNKSMDSHLSYVWATTASYGMKGSANISGTAYAAESWLISPVLDLTNATSAKLTFDHTTYAASSTDDLDYLLVYVSSDGGSHWTNLTIPTWPSKRWTFVSSGEIDLTTYASSNVKIAFCYKSTSTYAGTWEVKNVVLTGKYDKTISTSSVEHVSGYPKNVSGTSASVTGLDASTTYKYTVTPQGGSASNEIEVTTPACSCTATITVQSPDDTMGTVTIE